MVVSLALAAVSAKPSWLAYDSCIKGLNKLEINHIAIQRDLQDTWEVLAEPVQMVMRRFGIKNPYERLKALTRGKSGISQETLHQFIQTLEIPDKEKQQLLALTPTNYIGLAEKLAKDFHCRN